MRGFEITRPISDPVLLGKIISATLQQRLTKLAAGFALSGRRCEDELVFLNGKAYRVTLATEPKMSDASIEEVINFIG